MQPCAPASDHPPAPPFRYAHNLLGKPLSPHTWLRYSTFLVLYPLGVAGEIMCYLAALPALREVAIPGSQLSLGEVISPALWLYRPGFPFLYFYMLGQRAKTLKSLGAKKKAE